MPATTTTTTISTDTDVLEAMAGIKKIGDNIYVVLPGYMEDEEGSIVPRTEEEKETVQEVLQGAVVGRKGEDVEVKIPVETGKRVLIQMSSKNWWRRNEREREGGEGEVI
jgi:hypothetical protein